MSSLYNDAYNIFFPPSSWLGVESRSPLTDHSPYPRAESEGLGVKESPLHAFGESKAEEGGSTEEQQEVFVLSLHVILMHRFPFSSKQRKAQNTCLLLLKLINHSLLQISSLSMGLTNCKFSFSYLARHLGNNEKRRLAAFYFCIHCVCVFVF